MGRHTLGADGPFTQPGADGVEQRPAAPSPSGAPASSDGLDWLPGWERDSGERAEAAAVAAPKARRRPSVFQMLLGFVGELLITAGVVIGLFIVWQVWWTDIIAGQEQEEQIARVKGQWGSQNETKIGGARTDPPPAVEHVTGIGDVEGIMYIPKFGKDYEHSIEYGTSLSQVLDKGAFGHYKDTAYVGEVGNYSLAAHRQTYGAPMRNVDKLKAGDPIIVGTKDAYFVYYVNSSYVVSPNDVDVVAPVPKQPETKPTERLMTITTCHPPFVSDKRWIIHAKYDHWVARSDGIPAEMK